MLQTDKKYRDKNRYIDILPYEHTRVKLVQRPQSEGKGYPEEVQAYINANFVDSPLKTGDKKIIASQGPLPDTTEDFWRMISEQNVTLIVTTCKVYENGRMKCNKFWIDPYEEKSMQVNSSDASLQKELEFVGLTLKPDKEELEISEHLTVRKYYLSDSVLGYTDRLVVQVHYSGWPDHGVPTAESLNCFQTMLEIFTFMLLTSKPEEKAIVHCSAGIGRTGTTIGLAHILSNLWSQKNQGVADPKLSIFSVIRRLREQRFHLVQMHG